MKTCSIPVRAIIYGTKRACGIDLFLILLCN